MITHITDKMRMCSEALRDSTEQCRVYRAEIDQWEVDYNEMKLERDQFKADAERYRHWTTVVIDMTVTLKTKAEVDAVVDASMKGTS